LSSNLFMALLHHPVYKKNGEIITTSITPMDLHDIARSCLTFGVEQYYVVNPLPTMKHLANRISEFWRSDYGSQYNRTRTDAFAIMTIVDHLEDCLSDIEKRTGQRVCLVATSAKRMENSITFQAFREKIESESTPYLILLGTGYGLIHELIKRCDYLLEPIEGAGEYNHLSVRSAAAIMLDRLCGKRKSG